MFAEDPAQHRSLDEVVGDGRGAVGVDMADVPGRDLGVRERGAQRPFDAQALGVRGDRGVGVAGGAVAGDVRAYGGAAGQGVFRTLQHQ